MDMMRSMMAYTDLQIVFWEEALSTVAYLEQSKDKVQPFDTF